VSSIAFSPTHNGMLAIGSYSHTTAVYAEANMELLYVLHGQIGGVTQVDKTSPADDQIMITKYQENYSWLFLYLQVLFSKDGNYIYTGGRKVTKSC